MVQVTPSHSYWLCVTPRSGSSLLCQVMGATGVMGRPDEYCWWDNMPSQANPWGFAAKWGIQNHGEYWDRCLQEGTSPNGWFGVKMAPGIYMETFLTEMRSLPEYNDPDLGRDDLIRKIFPDLRMVFLTRRDKLRQAISMVKAYQKNLWTSEQEIDPQGTLVYDREALDIQIRAMALAECAWQEIFTAWDLQPLALTYEDYRHDYEGTLGSIAEYLGIEERYEFDESKISLKRLSDDVTEEWVQRYWAEKPLG